MIRPASLLSLLRSLAIAACVGIACGAASALFLTLLERATSLRTSHVELVFALPIAGLAMGALYDRYGKPIQPGANLVIERLHAGGEPIPLRMAPMVLFGTLVTHLFGGSAGREGTAVQMGASLADTAANALRLGPALRKHALIAGVAGGFGSVFGTPYAGGLFALEFVAVGGLEASHLLVAITSSAVGDMITRALGVTHTQYPLLTHLELTPWVLAKWVAFAVAIAAACALFIELTHAIKVRASRWIPRLSLRMAAGGVAVIALWQITRTDQYLGLSVPLLVRAFSDPTLPSYAFALKLVFTAVTIGAGFLGGEVTPLFVTGGALGHVLARALGLPVELGTGVGLAAMFAAASNTPIALSVMAAELLGASVLPHAVIVCALAARLTGSRSIYTAQRGLQEK